MSSTWIQSVRSCFSSRSHEESTPLLPISNTDTKVQNAAQQALNKRPLHEGTIEGLMVSSDAVGGVSSIRSAISLGTKEAATVPDTLPIGDGILNIAIGALQGQRGLYAAKDAVKINDDTGVNISLTRLTRSPADIIRGGAKIATGGISAAGKTSALSGVVTQLGIVTSAGGAVTALSLGILCFNYMAEALAVKGQFEKKIKEGDLAAIQYLKEMRTLLPADKAKVFNQLFIPPKESILNRLSKKVATYAATKFFGTVELAADKALKAALKAATQGDLTLIKSIAQDYPADPLLSTHPRIQENLSPEEREIQRRLTAILGADHELTPTQIKQLVLNVGELYVKALENEQKRKETVFERTIGTEAKKLLDPLMNKDLAVLKAEEIHSVVKAAQKNLRNNVIILSLGFIAVTVWLGLIISAQIFSAGAYLIAEVVMSLVVSLGASIIDGYFLYQAYKDSHALKKDRIVILLATLLASAAAAVTTGFTKGIVNQAISGAAIFVWLGIILYTLYQWRNKPKEAGSTEGQNAPPARPITPDEGYQGSGLVPVN